MSLYIDENGVISLIQGDSGEIVVYGLDTNSNYDVYFAIQNTSLYLDKCRNKNINWNVSYQKLGKKITKYWTKEYKKFSLA